MDLCLPSWKRPPPELKVSPSTIRVSVSLEDTVGTPPDGAAGVFMAKAGTEARGKRGVTFFL